MRQFLVVLLGPLIFLSACADIQTFGSLAIEQRRIMNDMQARTTMHATCDISVGAYFRELNDGERRFTALICGGSDQQIGISGVPPLSAVAEIVVEAMRKQEVAAKDDYLAWKFAARQERFAREERQARLAKQQRQPSSPLRVGGAMSGPY